MKRLEELPKNRLIIQLLELNSSQHSNTNSSQSQSFRPTNSHINSLDNSHASSNSHVWDERTMYKKMFDEIDHNNDGKISFKELHSALIKGNPNSQFDQKTARILLNKYDSDNDNQIDFPEFYSLFIGINSQFNEFLDYDKDSSGTIDSKEFAFLLSSKGYNLNRDFLDNLMNEVYRYAGRRNSVTFDLYVRIIARLDHLRNTFNQNQSRHHKSNFQTYLIENFFLDF